MPISMKAWMRPAAKAGSDDVVFGGVIGSNKNKNY
jgi:hypothetical protein